MFGDALQNFGSVAKAALDGTTEIAKTTTSKGLKFTNDTLKQTIQTAAVAQNAANDVTQKVLETGKTSIDHAANITMKGEQSAENIVKNGLDITNAATDATADITSQGLQTTKTIAKTGLQKLGDITTTSINLTGNSLVALIGMVNNIVARRADEVTARREVDGQLARELPYIQIRKIALENFHKDMNAFKLNFTAMVGNQQKLLKSILNIYKLKHCKQGFVWGYTCSDYDNEKADEFQKELSLLIGQSETSISECNRLVQSANSNTFTIDNTVILEEYAKKIKEELIKLCQEASNIFTDILTRFKELASSIEKEEETTVGGKRRKKTKKTKKKTKKRKNSRTKRRNKTRRNK